MKPLMQWQTRSVRWLCPGVAIASLALAAPAAGQILGPVGSVTGALPDVGQVVGRTADDVVGRTGELVDRAAGGAERLAEDRVQRLSDLVRRNGDLLEADPAGDPVVRGEVVALAPTPGALDAARAAGFIVLRQTRLGGLGLDETVLAGPAKMSAREAIRSLRRLDPSGAYDFNHLYFNAGAERAAGPADVEEEGAQSDARVGLIDTGVAAPLPVFAGAKIETRGFAPGAPRPAAHGTATASLISGKLGGFRGAAPGAALYVADIYGSTPTGGSAEALAQALDWMAEVDAPVVNVSLVGPPNALVGAAVRALSARGARIVAAVGNDGPAAPPAYPASYPEVIAVTPVDGRGRVLPEAGRSLHVDYAAPGAGIVAADATGRLVPVRGASFAAPIVAGRLARLLLRENPAEAARALAALDREARPAGRAAGHGIIGEDVLAADRR